MKLLPCIALQVEDLEGAVKHFCDAYGFKVDKEYANETKLVLGEFVLYVEKNPARKIFLSFQSDKADELSETLINSGCDHQKVDDQGVMIYDPYGLNFFLSKEGM
jgi:predicted lactoylglutathione lyase